VEDSHTRASRELNVPPPRHRNGVTLVTWRKWLAGARPRTLPAAAASVIAGTGAAALTGQVRPSRALLALIVALSLQIAVNYANDYSDGIRGTDAHRVGPQRLVGSGAAEPRAVKRAAFAAFGIAGAAGLTLSALASWWLVAIGAAAIFSAWGYTGGPRPYGYAGLGELFVFIFFGPVAVCGTFYVQAGRISTVSIVCGVAMGLLTTAVLVANNLRDIDNDSASGKRTLRAARPVMSGIRGWPLVAVLQNTARTEIVYAFGLLLGFALSHR
jgi:1,4-dihydroxy-2-naphthoate octaprenyltransferase